ncbi:TPR-like protein [Lactarius hengduanensis]|nr:TPR-like protein [Lactarius hengduanensis]
MSQLSQNSQTTSEGTESVEADLTPEQGTPVEETVSGSLEKARLAEADEIKQEGNNLFRLNKWDDALQSYRNGLARLPERRKPSVPPATDEKSHSPPAEGEGTPSTDAEESLASGSSLDFDSSSPLEGECAKARSVFNANIAACYVKLGENENAVKACTEALQDDPSYIRVLLRRAQCNEKIGSWSALSSAKEDYTALLTQLPSSSNQVAEVNRSSRLLEPRIEEAQKREVGEVVDKLKGLGNSVLGRFGLSTDNFKFEPNGQGGYSLNFTQ